MKTAYGIKLIKGGQVYGPAYLGRKDILLVGGKIGYIRDEIQLPKDFLDIEIIDGRDKYIVPGFIDSHVHICGGGGEGGFRTRTPEIMLTDLTLGGITTVIGVLGTDGTTRTMTNLIAKAKGLEEEGISSYIYTGSYQVPVRTVTGNIQDDIILIDKIIGVGEIALSDHRSSQPSREDIRKLAAEARVGGILSGKAGVVNIHMGSGSRQLDYIEEIVEKTEIPISQFLPTHMGRDRKLMERAIEYGKKGGYVDFTTSSDSSDREDQETSPSRALKTLLDQGVSPNNITFSSDGQGSLPKFDENGNFTGLGIGKATSLYREVRDAIRQESVPMEKALKTITSNPAKILKLENKGYIEEGKDGDLVILDQDSLDIDTVIAKGRIMVREGRAVVRGTFE